MMISLSNENKKYFEIFEGGVGKMYDDLHKDYSSIEYFSKLELLIALKALKIKIEALYSESLFDLKFYNRIDNFLKILRDEILMGRFEFYEYGRDVYSDPHKILFSRMRELNPEFMDYFCLIVSDSEQSSGDFLLFLVENYKFSSSLLKTFIDHLAEFAIEHVKTVFPAKEMGELMGTVSFGYVLSAYVEKLVRCRELSWSRSQLVLQFSPYAGIRSSGTILPLNRTKIAKKMGFEEAAWNNLSAVTIWHQALDFAGYLKSIAVALLSFVEEMLLWVSQEYSYIHVASYNILSVLNRNKRMISAIMRDAGAIEDVVLGANLGFAAHAGELRRLIVSANLKLLRALREMGNIFPGLDVNCGRVRELSIYDYSCEFDLFVWLYINTDMDVVAAMKCASRVVSYARDQGRKLSLISEIELQEIDKRITPEVLSVLTPKRNITSKRCFGGPNPIQVRKNLKKLALTNCIGERFGDFSF